MRRSLASVLVFAIISGCSSTSAPVGTGTLAAPSGGTVPTPATDGSTAAPSGDPRVSLVLDAVGRIGSADDVAEAEDHMLDAFANSSGLITDLGADTWAFTNQMAHDELAKAGQNLTVTGEAALVAALGDIRPPRVAVAGAAGIGLAFATAMISTGFPSGTNLNVPLNSTQTQTLNGETTTGTMTGHITYSVQGSQVTADVEFGIDIKVTDASTGAAIRSGNFRSQGKITLDFCPDVNGKVVGHISVAISGGTSGAGSASIQIDAEVGGTVGDNAVLNEIAIDGNSTQTTTPRGGSARTLTTTTSVRAPIGRGGSVSTMNIGQATGQSITQGPGDLTQAEADAAAQQIGSASGAAIYLIADYAQKKWQGGECVEIRTTEPGRKVRKSETVQFETTVWHKIDGTQLNKKIVNQFSGKASIDPVGIEGPAPVTNSYKAGSRNGDKGTIDMTTTSNRGIGKLTIEFEVQGGWIIDTPNRGGRLHGQKCGDPPGDWVVEGTYSALAMDGDQKWTITIDASGTSGTFVYNVSQQGFPGGSPVKVYVVGLAYGNVTLSIDPADGRAHMHLKETRHTYAATTEVGGHGEDYNAPLEQYDFDWDVGGTC